MSSLDPSITKAGRSSRARVLTWPLLYWGWLVFVAIALPTSYFSDPYIFGLTTLVLAWASGVIALMGLGAAVGSRTATAGTRLSIIAAVVLTAACIVAALTALSAINWA